MIECPHCHKTFELDEALDLKLQTHVKEEIEKKLQLELESRLAAERKQAGSVAEERVTEKFQLELARLQEQAKIKENQALEMMKREEALKAEKDKLALEFTRKLEEGRKSAVQEEAIRLQREFEEKNRALVAANEASRKKLDEFQQREADFELRRQALETEVNQKLQQKLAAERVEAEKRAQAELAGLQKKIASEFEQQMKALQLENSEKEEKFKEMRQRQLELEAEKRRIREEFEEAEHRKKLAFEDEKAREQRLLKERLEFEFAQKLLEKESQIEAMRKNAESMQKQARQGLARNQGEAQEEYIKRKLIEQFPGDRVEDIKTGKLGADLKLSVFSESRMPAGLVLIESKNAENFSNGWIEKLKQDRERENADVAVLVTTALPDKMEHFGLRDGVWICAPIELIPMMEVLRVALVDIAKTRASMVGFETKAGRLYEYLTSVEFGQRVGTVLDTFRQLKEQLEKERTAFEKQWAEREKLLSSGNKALAAVFGHVGGIAGNDLPGIEQLSLPG